MATSSGSSRQPLAPERPTRVSRTGKAPQRETKRHGKHAHQQHHKRPSMDYETEEEDDEAEAGLSRDEAALIDARFHRAVDIIQSLPKSGPITTTYEEKLMLYSLYKQGVSPAFQLLCINAVAEYRFRMLQQPKDPSR